MKNTLLRNASATTLSAAIFALTAPSASAANIGFTGAVDNDWQNAGNWDAAPTNDFADVADDLTVGGAFSPTSSAAVFIGSTGAGSLGLNTSGTTTFDSHLGTGWTHPGQITQTSGTTDVGQFLFMGITPGAQGRYDMDGGILNVQGFLLMGDAGGAGGIFEQTAGSVSIGLGGGAGIDYIALASAANSSGTYSISGGSLTGTNELSIGAHPVNPPSAGAVGLFEVIGTGPSSITVANLRVRNGTGTLRYQMGAGGVTPVTATTAVNVGGGILDIDTSALTFGGPVTLINNTSGGAIGGVFSNASEGTLFGGRALTFLGGDGNDLVLLPEPSAILLLAVGLVPVAARRRR